MHWSLKSPSLRLFTQPFFSVADQRKNTKAPCHWPFWGESSVTGEFPSQRAGNAKNVLWTVGRYRRHISRITELSVCYRKRPHQRRITNDNKVADTIKQTYWEIWWYAFALGGDISDSLNIFIHVSHITETGEWSAPLKSWCVAYFFHCYMNHIVQTSVSLFQRTRIYHCAIQCRMYNILSWALIQY